METDTILSAEGLTRQFGGFMAIDGLSLSVKRHTIHALIGPNGAGKTTCFNLLTKFLPPTRGTIVYDGKDITRTAPAAVARMGLVRSFQISAVFTHLTVLENVRVALQRRYGSSFEFWRSGRSLRKLDAEAAELIEAVGLADFVRSPAGELSYGRKRALEIATTLAVDPKILLLDEPMAGIGHGEIDRVTELIREAAVGRTVLMVEHNLSVVATLSDRITVMARGKVLAEGDYAMVSRDPRVIEAYIGSSHGR
jgi:branched-chain amino acid transport system ATP-binding protein